MSFLTRYAWNVFATVGVACCVLSTAARPALARSESASSKSGQAGYFLVQGRQVLLLTEQDSATLHSRAREIRNRLAGAIVKDGTVQPIPQARVDEVGGSPVIALGTLRVATITKVDATRSGHSPWELASRSARSLNAALSTLRVGGCVPTGFNVLKLAGGQSFYLASDGSWEKPGGSSIALKRGRMAARIEAGVVTLTGQAETLAEKLEVARKVAEIPGVVQVVDLLAVISHAPASNSELAAALPAFVF